MGGDTLKAPVSCSHDILKEKVIITLHKYTITLIGVAAEL